MKAGPKSSLRPFLHRALQLFNTKPGVASLIGPVTATVTSFITIRLDQFNFLVLRISGRSVGITLACEVARHRRCDI